MRHEIFFKIFDGSQTIFLCSIFVILLFKLRGLQQRLDMLNKSHPLSRYKANSGKNEEKCLMRFDPDARVFVLSN